MLQNVTILIKHSVNDGDQQAGLGLELPDSRHNLLIICSVKDDGRQQFNQFHAPKQSRTLSHDFNY